MICDKELWHKPSERPKAKSSIILVHHYFFDKQSVDIAWIKENGYNFSLHYPADNNWYDWEWKIEKWCYVDDLIKVKHISFE